jgi:hypothetical protein
VRTGSNIPAPALGEKVILAPYILNQVLWSMRQMANDCIRNLTEMARKDGSLNENLPRKS